MELIENSNERIVFVAKNYKICTKDGKRLTNFSNGLMQLGTSGSGLLAILPGLWLENFLIASNIPVMKGIVIIPFWILFFIVLVPVMRRPDPSRQAHRYTVTIDKVEKKLIWQRRGWHFYIPLRYDNNISLAAIRDCRVQNFAYCYELAIFRKDGMPISLSMPDESIASKIQQELRVAISDTPTNPLFDNVRYG